MTLTCGSLFLMILSSCWFRKSSGASSWLQFNLQSSFINMNSDTRAVRDKHVLFSVAQLVNMKDGICPVFSIKHGVVMDTLKTPAGAPLLSPVKTILQKCAALVSYFMVCIILEHLSIPGRLDDSVSVSWRTSAFWTAGTAERTRPGDCESLGWHMSSESFPLRTLPSTRGHSYTTASILPTTTRSPRRKASHADSSAGESRATPPASPRLYAELAGRLVGGFLAQIFPRHRRTADKADAEGVEAIVAEYIHRSPSQLSSFQLFLCSTSVQTAVTQHKSCSAWEVD